MLFISRRIGFDYGVVDTDDDTEEVVTDDELRQLHNVFGLTISGLTMRDYIEPRVVVYQPEETITPLQVKTRVMKHVDIKVYKDMITSIRFRASDIMGESVEIRLSDFGTRCADYVLAGNVYVGRFPKLRLIFDDKVSMCPNAFVRLPYSNALIGDHGIGVQYDLTDMSDKRAKQMYETLCLSKQTGMWDDIFDNETRKARIKYTYYSKLGGIAKCST